MYQDDDKLYIGGANQEAVITPDTEWINPITKELKYFQHINPSQPIATKDPYVDYQFYSPTGNKIVQTINSTPRWQQYWADREGSKVSNAMHQASPKVLDLLTAVDAVATGPEMLEGLYGLYKVGNGIMKDAFNTAKSYIKHPTYQTVYHGSPYPFNIKEFHRGTPRDLGLHVGPKDMAKSAGFNHTRNNGNTLYKLRIPRASTETIDIHDNGVRHLSKDYVWGAHPYYTEMPNSGYYFLSSGNKTLPKWIEETGTKLTVKPDDYRGFRMWTDKDAHINLREKAFPNISNEDQIVADRLLSEAEKYNNVWGFSGNPEASAAMSRINAEANDLLSRNGYNVIKYYNNNEAEGAANAFILTNPDVMDVIPNMDFQKYKTIWDNTVKNPIPSHGLISLGAATLPKKKEYAKGKDDKTYLYTTEEPDALRRAAIEVGSFAGAIYLLQPLSYDKGGTLIQKFNGLLKAQEGAEVPKNYSQYNSDLVNKTKQFILDWAQDRLQRTINYTNENNAYTKSNPKGTEYPHNVKGYNNNVVALRKQQYENIKKALDNIVILTPDSAEEDFQYGSTKQDMLNFFQSNPGANGFYLPVGNDFGGKHAVYLRNLDDQDSLLHELVHASGLKNFGSNEKVTVPEEGNMYPLKLFNDSAYPSHIKSQYNYVTSRDEPLARLMVLRKHLMDKGINLHPETDMSMEELENIISNYGGRDDYEIFRLFQNDQGDYNKNRLLKFFNFVDNGPQESDTYYASKGGVLNTRFNRLKFFGK